MSKKAYKNLILLADFSITVNLSGFFDNDLKIIDYRRSLRFG